MSAEFSDVSDWTYASTVSAEPVKPKCATGGGGKPVENAKVPECKYDVNKKDDKPEPAKKDEKPVPLKNGNVT